MRARPTTPATRQDGMTVLELMVTLVIVGMLAYVGYGALRKLTRADLVEDTNRLAAMMGRAQELAGESGKLHRVTIDFEADTAVVEVCEGAPTVRRIKSDDEQLKPDDAKQKLIEAKEKLEANRSSGNSMQRGFSASTPEDETKMAAALAGHHVGDQACTPVTDAESGDAEGKPLVLHLQKDEEIKPREVWVQHRDDSVTSGQVSIYFFPIGSAEKAIIELADGGDAVYALKVHGLTGEVETVDGQVRDAEDYMKRNIEGEKEADR